MLMEKRSRGRISRWAGSGFWMNTSAFQPTRLAADRRGAPETDRVLGNAGSSPEPVSGHHLDRKELARGCWLYPAFQAH
jgi:hypothetical protein